MRVSWQVVRWRHRRRRLWVTPTLIVLGVMFMSWFLAYLDREVVAFDEYFIFDLGATASTLSSIASGVIAFTGFVFTAVTLSLQFGTSSFSARLIPLFQRDPVIRIAVGVFAGTFVYAMLQAFRLGVREYEYKLVFSSGFAVVLALGSVVMFFLLLDRIVGLLRAVRLLRRVSAKGAKAIRAIYPLPYGAPGPAQEAHEPEPAAGPVTVIHYYGPSGALRAVDVQGLARLAGRCDVRFRLLPAIGDFITAGNALLEVAGDAGQIRPHQLDRCLVVREERDLDTDPAFAIRAIVDVANKALSAAVNDPTTAVQALDCLEELLIRLGGRALDRTEITDGEGVVRLRYRAPAWEDYVSLATDEIRRYGSGSLQVVRRLRALLDDVEAAVPAERHPPLQARREALDALCATYEDPLDRTLAEFPDAQGIGSGQRAHALARTPASAPGG